MEMGRQVEQALPGSTPRSRSETVASCSWARRCRSAHTSRASAASPSASRVTTPSVPGASAIRLIDDDDRPAIGQGTTKRSPAREALDLRFARGELSVEDYQERVRILGEDT